MTSRASTRLLFSGKKCFWKSNIFIEVLFVQHSPAQIIEIIAYDHTLKCEAPHLYVDEGALLMKLEGLGGGASKAEENKQHLDRAKVAFLYDRINVSNCSPGSQGIEIYIKNRDEVGDLLIVKPGDLVAYVSPFAQILRHANGSADKDKDNLQDLLSPRSVCSAGNSSPADLPVGIAEIAQLYEYCDDVQAQATKGVQSADTSAHLKDVRMGVAEAPLPAAKEKLPSPKSVIDMTELAHGASPRPLYANKATSSPSSPSNPRIVSRRRASAEPLTSQQSAKADHHTSALVPALPLKFESRSAPSSPHHSKVPLLRALSCTLSTLRLGLLSSSLLPSQSQSNSHSSNSDGETAECSVQVDGAPVDAAVAQSPRTPRTELLNRQLALDTLRMPLPLSLLLPWTAGHGHCNKISPSVSAAALDQLDQLELEVRAFER